MANSFPSIISNEPPELLSDEDDDSEEYRDFSSGLKVDIDPSPVSSPRKSKIGHVSTPSPLSLPSSLLPNGTQIPLNSSSSNDTVFQDNNNISPTEQVLEQTNKVTESFDDLSPLPAPPSSTTATTQFLSNNNNNNKNSIAINNVMKTSYIGTIESLEDEEEEEEDDDNDVESIESKIIKTELGPEKTINNSVDENNFVAFENNLQQSVPVIQQNENEVKDNTEDPSENVSEDQYTPPESNFHSLTENKEDNGTNDDDIDDEFEDFQEFQATSVQKVEGSNESDVIKKRSEEENNSINVESNCELDTVSPEKDSDTVLPNITTSESLISSSTLTPKDEIESEDTSGSPSNNNECTNQLNNDNDFCDCSTEVVESKENFILESSLSETIPPKVKNEASSVSVVSDQITAQIDSDKQTIEFQVDCTAFSDPSEQKETEINKKDTVDDNSQEFDINNSEYDDFDNFQDFQTSSAIITTSQNTEDSFQQISNNSLEPSNTVVDSSSSYKLESVNSLDESQPSTSSDLQNESDNQRQQQQQIPSLSNLDSFTDENKHDDDFDDFDDFQAFQSPSTLQSVPMPSVITTTQSSSTEMSTSSVISSSSSTTTNTSTTLTSKTGDTNFQSNITSSSLLENKFETLVKSLFPSAPITNDEIPEDVSNFKTIDKELKEDRDNQQWSRVEDFEGSQGLLFKWLNSCAYQKLLKSLKIDSSTIMYSGKWGPIPRFAASLVESPLLPESGSKTGDLSQINTESNSNNSKETLSPAENESGVRAEAGGTSGGQISQEAEQIITQLPDLSYMRSKTLVFPHILQVQTLARDV